MLLIWLLLVYEALELRDVRATGGASCYFIICVLIFCFVHIFRRFSSAFVIFLPKRENSWGNNEAQKKQYQLLINNSLVTAISNNVNPSF